MIINGVDLLQAAPIKDMLAIKVSNPKFPTSYGLSEIGYDIRIKQDVHYFPATYTNNQRAHVCVVDADSGETKRYSGKFCLASSLEEFQMPLELGGVGHDKSTFARLGVQVFNTVIEPGWKGFLTLELVFNGEEALHIPAGTGIMQVIFHLLSQPAQYDGKYQGQPDAPVPAKTSLPGT